MYWIIITKLNHFNETQISRIFFRSKSNEAENLEQFNENEKEDEKKEKSKNKQEDDDDVSGGNVIFANVININYKEKKLTPLYIIMSCYLLFCIIELVCGYYSNSITLKADAAHYFSESSCFAIFIVSIYSILAWELFLKSESQICTMQKSIFIRR